MDLSDLAAGMMSRSLSKPPVPYTRDWRFTVKSHVPPAPTLVTDGCCKYDEDDFEEIKRLSPTERCLQRPPLPGEMGSDTIDLEVTDLLRVGDCCNSQVFTVRVLRGTPKAEKPPPPDARLVAKVYDPLYYDDEEYFVNPFLAMDQCYTHEARAYHVLSEFQGRHIPIFYV